MDWIRSQAMVYKNLPLLVPRYKSVVHLEDDEDKTFWDEQLQKHRPGKYFYVTYSKSNKGNETRGCDQCLKFKPYLDSHFFICIDSDLRYLMGEPDLDATHYVIQTYTYSFENHYCEKTSLQTSVAAKANGCGFDFTIFLQNLSNALYEPLLLLLFCKRTGDNTLTEKTFRQVLKTQCTGDEMKNNGQEYVNYITSQFAPYLSGATTIGFDLAKESALYKQKKLDASNAYLHVRGHNIYDLVSYIGKRCCNSLQKGFEKDVLANVAVCGTYWEYTELEKDLKSV